MFQGYYNLASGMLTQNRNLSVISNNMANMATPGFKSDAMTSTTFAQEMLYRTGSQNKDQTAIGNINMIRVPEQTVTNFEDGNYVSTGVTLDFAIRGKGFFRIATENGSVYTRNGSFCVDEQGYLALKGVGRVQGSAGDIYLDTDQISADAVGNLYDAEGGQIDNLEIVDFADYNTLVKGSSGIFTTNAQPQAVEIPSIFSETLEGSNVDAVRVMQDMITTQRSFQSASQLLKIYDQIMGRATAEIGRF